MLAASDVEGLKDAVAGSDFGASFDRCCRSGRSWNRIWLRRMGPRLVGLTGQKKLNTNKMNKLSNNSMESSCSILGIRNFFIFYLFFSYRI
jgi:hypothetical protein